MLIDQHVAHERILFDRFRRANTENRSESQNLLIPETLDLTPAEAEVFESVSETLAALASTSCGSPAERSPSSPFRQIFRRS